MVRILIAGELNPDLILRDFNKFPRLGHEVVVDDMALTLGSASAICAVGLARLGDAVSILGKVGCDGWGDFCCDFLRRSGVDISTVIHDPAVRTGLTVSITSAADRALITYLGAIENLKASEIQLPHGFTHLHISSYFLQRGLRAGCLGLFREAHSRGWTTSLDPGCDPTDEWGSDILDTLEEVDIFLPNEVELAGISRLSDPERALRRLQNGRTLTVAKLGARGCMTLDGGRVIHAPALRVRPIDTTGAGDSFDAGFLHAWLGGRTLMQALRFAVVCGGVSTQGSGGTGCQASEEEAEEKLRELAWH
ncbi:carbohydrate kinase family protein [Paludibaculum fermentans]|uniref:Sugar kinase n=1 Tax=Paludibaculum fermentans TaxID=1473598 RepID=A0A7S7NW90_PALFE|nr:sugar kinase [Paludibaculum fermentans]QOY90942.1 sugar kinase [Paludibaculum fermentans]